MHTSILTLQSQLEQAKERLKGVEENIKKNTGRDPSQAVNRPGFKRNARFLEDQGAVEGVGFKKRFSEGIKGRLGDWGPPTTPVNEKAVQDVRGPRSAPPHRGRIVSRPFNLRNQPPREFVKGRLEKVDDNRQRISAKKRLGDVQPTSQAQSAVTVFSRLSGPPREEQEEEKIKITSQVLVQETPSRKEILEAQNKDTSCKERNRRMFGALMGTLQKFRQEENKLREKEEKKAEVERRVEEAAEREKEEAKKARQQLFSTRRQEQINIRHIQFKLLKLKQLEEWETNKSKLMPFIGTETTPKIFYLPKAHNDKTKQLLQKHQDIIQREIEKKRKEIEKIIEDNLQPNTNIDDQGDEEMEGEMESEEVVGGDKGLDEEGPAENNHPQDVKPKVELVRSCANDDDDEEAEEDSSSSSSSRSSRGSSPQRRVILVKQEPIEEVDRHASDKENHVLLQTATVKMET